MLLQHIDLDTSLEYFKVNSIVQHVNRRQLNVADCQIFIGGYHPHSESYNPPKVCVFVFVFVFWLVRSNEKNNFLVSHLQTVSHSPARGPSQKVCVFVFVFAFAFFVVQIK